MWKVSLSFSKTHDFSHPIDIAKAVYVELIVGIYLMHISVNLNQKIRKRAYYIVVRLCGDLIIYGNGGIKFIKDTSWRCWPVVEEE